MLFFEKENHVIKIFREDGHGIDMEKIRDYIPFFVLGDFPIKIKNHCFEIFGTVNNNPGIVN